MIKMPTFCISDLHIGHKNVIRHDGRPFEDLEAMHTAIIENWNNAVSENDDVYILGDFAWKNSVGAKVLSQLKGRKYLILGNHDKPNDEMKACFEWIKNYAVIN